MKSNNAWIKAEEVEMEKKNKSRRYSYHDWLLLVDEGENEV